MDGSEKRGPEFYRPDEPDKLPWLAQPPEETERPEGTVRPPQTGGPARPEAAGHAAVPPLACLTALLAAGFLLMTVVCVLQFRDSRKNLDELRRALEEVQTMDRLREENEQLRKDAQDLEGTLTQMGDIAVDRAQELAETRHLLNIAEARLEGYRLENAELQYFWYIQSFMESGDYAMAACAVYGDNGYGMVGGGSLNSGQYRQYTGYRQKLFDMGYLDYEVVQENIRYGQRLSTEAARWYELWIAFMSFYFEEEWGQAVSALVDWTGEHGALIQERQGSFVAEEYELLVETAEHYGLITVDERGGLDYGPRFTPDIRPEDMPDSTG